jgi:hypothetical protein
MDSSTKTKLLLTCTEQGPSTTAPPSQGETQNSVLGGTDVAMSQEGEEEPDLRLKSPFDGDADQVTQLVPAPKRDTPAGPSSAALSNRSKQENHFPQLRNRQPPLAAGRMPRRSPDGIPLAGPAQRTSPWSDGTRPTTAVQVRPQKHPTDDSLCRDVKG